MTLTPWTWTPSGVVIATSGMRIKAPKRKKRARAETGPSPYKK